MGFKIEKPAPRCIKMRTVPLPSIPRRLVHLLSALRPENDRDTSVDLISRASRSEVDYRAVRSDRESSLALFDAYRRYSGDFESSTRGHPSCISVSREESTREAAFHFTSDLNFGGFSFYVFLF